MADNTKFVSLPPKQLTEPLSTSATTLYTNNLNFDLDGTRTLTLTDLGDYGWIVLEPRSVQNREICKVTGISGTQLTIARGYKPFAPYDQDTATWAKTHSVGVSFVFTNAPQMYNEFAVKDNDETIDGLYTFTQSPVVPTAGTGTQAANHDDIAAAVTGASGTATNLVAGTAKLSVAAASAPNPIVVGDNDPRVPTSGQTALLAAITADAAEINKLDGMTATQFQLNEAGTFFGSTDITGAEAETLTSGSNSNATTKHIHAYAGTPFEITFTRAESAGYVSVPNINSAIGWTDENDLLTYTYSDTGSTDRTTNYRFSDAALVGVQPYNSRRDSDTGAGFNMTTAVSNGALYIGTDRFHSNGTSIFKNGSALAFSGTARYGKLAHNPTTSSLLVLYSTTAIAQFSGIAGTTITNLNTDITLDTAVNNTINFIYDNANSQYIAVDTVNSVIRRFNSSGVTVDTVSYVDMLVGEEANSLAGICIFQDRVFLIIADSRGHMTVTGSGTDTASRHRLRFYPTAMTR